MMTDTHGFGPWKKSSYSNGAQGNCVEAGSNGVRIGVRDTKDVEGGMLAFDRSDWGRFVVAIR